MGMSTHIKPISYLKSNAAQIASELQEDGELYIITKNGEPAMVVQSVAEYERKENTVAMLQLIAQGRREIEQKNMQESDKAFGDIRAQLGLDQG